MKIPTIPLILGIGILFSLLAFPVAAQQGPQGKATDAEIAQLPSYCQARVRRDSGQMKLWSGRMGHENFVHLHHFCNGLIYLHRATSSFDEKKRRQNINAAVRNMDYVLQRWAPEFPLYQEAETYKMQAESLRKGF